MLVIRHVSSSTTSDPVRGTDIVDTGFVIVPRPAGVGDALDVGSDLDDVFSLPDMPDVPNVSGFPGYSGDTVVPDFGAEPKSVRRMSECTVRLLMSSGQTVAAESKMSGRQSWESMVSGCCRPFWSKL